MNWSEANELGKAINLSVTFNTEWASFAGAALNQCVMITLTSMNKLAEVLNCQAKYDEAEKMHRQALGLEEAVLGKEYPSTLASMNNLTEVLELQPIDMLLWRKKQIPLLLASKLTRTRQFTSLIAITQPSRFDQFYSYLHGCSSFLAFLLVSDRKSNSLISFTTLPT
jgi:hypothetical protein